ncbi:Tim10/DDP family zinc finger-domain-containing protein [Aspergillus venezuelensis]|uniref:protein translocase subunit TIM13 n=1 Tax=Aspergillus stella-maris TaxID=1810926 RepID=UPI003CCCF1DA
MALFGSSSSSAAPATSDPEQAQIKAEVLKQLQTQAAIANAKALIGKVNEHCFNACIPQPGSSMSSGESACLSQCMEKYISFWNVSSKAYLSRLSKEKASAQGLDMVSANALATGGMSESDL